MMRNSQEHFLASLPCLTTACPGLYIFENVPGFLDADAEEFLERKQERHIPSIESWSYGALKGSFGRAAFWGSASTQLLSIAPSC